MNLNQAIIYTKKEGVNRLLPIDSNSDLVFLAKYVKERFPEEAKFAHVLIDGVEIKLF